jgi:hypothetical protein
MNPIYKSSLPVGLAGVTVENIMSEYGFQPVPLEAYEEIFDELAAATSPEGGCCLRHLYEEMERAHERNQDGGMSLLWHPETDEIVAVFDDDCIQCFPRLRVSG